MNIIKHAHLTEKSINNIELNNEIVFIVDKKATKPQIKKSVEEMFKVKVKNVNLNTDTKGRKKAYVKLMPDFSALDIATKLGMM